MRTLRLFVLAPVIAAHLLGAASAALADWPAGLTLHSGYGSSWGVLEGYLLPGAAPGELYALGSANTYYHWWAHRFTTDGVNGWATPLSSSYNSEPGPSMLGGFGYAPDGAGGFLHAYRQGYGGSTFSLRSAHVDAGGVLFPGAGQIGYAVDSAFSRPTALAAEGGGAWYAWSRGGVRVMRVDATGQKSADWPLRGWRVPGLPVPQSIGTGLWLAPDGAGGVFVSVADSVMRVQRVGPDTTIAPGWPAAGLQLRLPGAAVFGDPRTTIVPSGTGGFFAAWIEGSGPYDLRLQRFSLAGARDPAWPAAGLHLGVASSALRSWMFRCFPGPDGDVTVTWVDDDGSGQALVYAIRVLADGSLASGYAAGPKLLAALDLYLIRPATLGVAICPGRNGGLLVASVDLVSATGYEHALRGRWFDAAGEPDPSPELHVADLSADVPADEEITALAAHPDGSGGAFVLVACNGEAYPSSYAVVAHVTQRSVLDAGPAGPVAALALRISPNPAHGRFAARVTLPDARPATLELLDVSGRRLWRCEVRGAGPHELRVEPPGTLAPGVYLARLSQGAASRTARVVSVR